MCSASTRGTLKRAKETTFPEAEETASEGTSELSLEGGIEV